MQYTVASIVLHFFQVYYRYSVQYSSRLALALKTVMVNSSRDCIMDLNQNLIELRGLVRW